MTVKIQFINLETWNRLKAGLEVTELTLKGHHLLLRAKCCRDLSERLLVFPINRWIKCCSLTKKPQTIITFYFIITIITIIPPVCYFLLIWFKVEFHRCRRQSIMSFTICSRHLSRWLRYRRSSQQQRGIMGVDTRIISNTGLVHVIRHGVASQMKPVIYHLGEGRGAEATPRWRRSFTVIGTLTLLTKTVRLCLDSRKQKHKMDKTHLI